MYLWYQRAVARRLEDVPSAGGSGNHTLDVAVDHIRKNYSYPLTVEETARRCGVDRSHLFRLFKRHLGISPQQYLLNLRLTRAQELLRTLRASKTEEEIQSMIAAQRISEKALEEVLQIIRPGMTEREVMAELVYHMLRNGSEGNSFDPIVVTGANTSMPHGVPGDTVIQAGDFITMDFGSLKNGYCSDMTRTVAVGYATEEMKNVYDIVLKAQLAGIAAARSGVLGKEIDAAARKVITEAGYGPYFGHGFGHSLGLDIHEPPFAGPTGNVPMAENDLCSAEPGIYLPGKFGVRIEDVMIIRSTGAEVITKAPKRELIVL